MAKISQKIDRLTNSIVNRISGDSFNTNVLQFQKSELRAFKKKWKFDWAIELKEATVYKLVICEYSEIVQGLISIEDEKGFVYMRLVETAPHNFGKNKVYEGVLGNLVAFACKISFEKGFDGFVAFDAKTNLINHYSKTLKAKLISGSRMFIDTDAARYLVNTYFNK
jgi:hypothetical protein